MHFSLFDFLQTHPFLGYLAVFIAMIVEGDIAIFTAAFLTHQGFFNLPTMFATMYSGVIMGDLFWYWVGHKLNSTPSFINNWVSKITSPFDDHLLNRPFHTIFISKFIYGIHHAILIRAGALKLKLSKFFEDDLVCSLFWIIIIGGLGFVSSFSFTLLRHYIKYVELFFLVFALIFIGVWHFLAKRAKKRL